MISNGLCIWGVGPDMTNEFGAFMQRELNIVMQPNRIFASWAATILLLCAVQAPIARADPASCIEKVSSYVAEVDQLLATEKNWITPFHDLN